MNIYSIIKHIRYQDVAYFKLEPYFRLAENFYKRERLCLEKNMKNG